PPAARTSGAAVQLAADHHAHAHAGADPQVHEVADAASVPPPPLAERRKVHVVVEADGRAHLGPESLDEALPAPPGEVGRHLHEAAVRIEHARAPHAGLRHLAPPDPGLGGDVAGDPADLPDQRPGTSDPGPLSPPGHDGTGDVGDGGPDVLSANLDPGHPPGHRVEL